MTFCCIANSCLFQTKERNLKIGCINLLKGASKKIDPTEETLIRKKIVQVGVGRNRKKSIPLTLKSRKAPLKEDIPSVSTFLSARPDIINRVTEPANIINEPSKYKRMKERLTKG